MISTRWGVAVVIPAHNEASRIATTLRAAAHSLAQTIVSFRVDPNAALLVVVADCCEDNTAALAQAEIATFQQVQGIVVIANGQNVGAARRQGCCTALRYLSNWPYNRVWLAHTDADTTVPPTWIDRHLDEADQGAVAVAGIVRVDSLKDHPPHIADRFSAIYLTNPDGSHPHVHGANLGTRADVYCHVGGWYQTSLAEDHCLWNRIRRRYPVRATTRSWVMTSGRAVGRAAGGFADTLCALAHADADMVSIALGVNVQQAV